MADDRTRERQGAQFSVEGDAEGEGRSEVVNRFSHRLRSMLTSIGAAAEYLHNDELDRGTRTEMLGIISTQADGIEGLLDDFLVVQGELCGAQPGGNVVDMYHITREAVRDLAPQAQSVGAWLVLDAEGDASTVFGYRSLLRQAAVGSLRAMINMTRPGDRVVARLRRVRDGEKLMVELAVTLESATDHERSAIDSGCTDLSIDAARRICENHAGALSMIEGCPGVVCHLPAAPLVEGPLSIADRTAAVTGLRCVAD